MDGAEGEGGKGAGGKGGRNGEKGERETKQLSLFTRRKGYQVYGLCTYILIGGIPPDQILISMIPWLRAISLL